MSKLFEVNNNGNRVTFHADKITHVSEVYRDSKNAKTLVHFTTDDFYLQIPYDEFVTLWRKALGDAVRTDAGWTEWNGGSCPVSPDTRIDAELRSGGTMLNWRACNIAWCHYNDGIDIVRYRVCKVV